MSLLTKPAVPLRPNEHVEQAIIRAILDGEIPPGNGLPGERKLAEQLGVTRSTLRETLHRLERDGWISINHGKPTMVNDIWREGNLNILSGIIRYGDDLSVDFIKNLLLVRSDLAPSYAFFASENEPQIVIQHLEKFTELADDPEKFASFDWELHYKMTIATGNPIYTLIINGFSEIYIKLAKQYFSNLKARASSLKYYQELLKIFKASDSNLAYLLTKMVMKESIKLLDW